MANAVPPRLCENCSRRVAGIMADVMSVGALLRTRGQVNEHNAAAYKLVQESVVAAALLQAHSLLLGGEQHILGESTNSMSGKARVSSLVEREGRRRRWRERKKFGVHEPS